MDRVTGRVRIYESVPATSPYRVDIVPSTILVRTASFKQVRGFDNSYFATFEDSDFCLRLRDRGCLTFVVPAARGVHITPSDPDVQQARILNRAFYIGRNRILFMHDHSSSLIFAAFSILFLPSYLIVYAGMFLRFDLKRHIKSYLKGVLDAYYVLINSERRDSLRLGLSVALAPEVE